MKKIILYFIGIIIGNYLCIEFAFVQDNTRFLALVGFLCGLYSIFQFSAKVAGFFIKRDFSINEITSANASKDKSLDKPASITLIIFVLLIGFHVWGYVSFFKYQDKLLDENGILTEAVVTERKWEKRGKNSPSEYYIYYTYKFNGREFNHSCPNKVKRIGDTIMVKFLPENPDNHAIKNESQ